MQLCNTLQGVTKNTAGECIGVSDLSCSVATRWRNVEKLHIFRSFLWKQLFKRLCRHFQSQHPPKMTILNFFWHSHTAFLGIFVAQTQRCRPVQYLSGDRASSVLHVFGQACSGFKWITAHYPQLLFRVSWEAERKPDSVVC